MALTETPRANRPHIALFGRRNAGKSSLINALTGQEIALVSPVAGTTADPVYKSFELRGVGPVVFVDTAGLDDVGPLGELRAEKTRQAMEKADLAVLVLTGPAKEELPWLEALRAKKIPVVAVLNQCDTAQDLPALQAATAQSLGGMDVLAVSAKTGQGIDQLRQALAQAIPADFWELSITGGLAQPGDLVLLVMPQDLQAPKGRLILPQVQTIRELLDKKCAVMSCTADCLETTLAALARPPKLIITDSQVFPAVWQAKPPESLLTSFSILFAGYKGDISAFWAGAQAIDRLTEDSVVLVAEACAHAPTTEDIGREKLPRLLRQRVGQGLSFVFVRGNDFPKDLSPYDLILHCGACMFNRRHVLGRIAQAQEQGVPICNYGVALAHLAGILEKVCHP
ncbi:MAG: [FeFe] hydrogenase H-cluster maturation GTPase HydF [Clostridiales bacterium]|nr:[FeFe] hydrogenase H-cluster maturation GTPase HydF [Clostridiales bacterium]